MTYHAIPLRTMQTFAAKSCHTVDLMCMDEFSFAFAMGFMLLVMLTAFVCVFVCAFVFVFVLLPRRILVLLYLYVGKCRFVFLPLLYELVTGELKDWEVLLCTIV